MHVGRHAVQRGAELVRAVALITLRIDVLNTLRIDVLSNVKIILGRRAEWAMFLRVSPAATVDLMVLPGVDVTQGWGMLWFD